MTRRSLRRRLAGWRRVADEIGRRIRRRPVLEHTDRSYFEPRPGVLFRLDTIELPPSWHEITIRGRAYPGQWTYGKQHPLLQVTPERPADAEPGWWERNLLVWSFARERTPPLLVVRTAGARFSNRIGSERSMFVTELRLEGIGSIMYPSATTHGSGAMVSVEGQGVSVPQRLEILLGADQKRDPKQLAAALGWRYEYEVDIRT